MRLALLTGILATRTILGITKKQRNAVPSSIALVDDSGNVTADLKNNAVVTVLSGNVSNAALVALHVLANVSPSSAMESLQVPVEACSGAKSCLNSTLDGQRTSLSNSSISAAGHEVRHATVHTQHNFSLPMMSLIEGSPSSLQGIESEQTFVDRTRASLYMIGLVVALAVPCCGIAYCWLTLPSDPKKLNSEKPQQTGTLVFPSITDESGKSIICHGLSQDSDFAAMRAKVDKSRGLSLNERSILTDGEAVLGTDRIGRTLKDMAVGDGLRLLAKTLHCPEVPLGIFRTFERIRGGPQGSCIRATVRIGWHGTVQVVIIKSLDVDRNIRFTESFLIDSVNASEEGLSLSLVKECKTSVFEKLWLAGAPGKRVLMVEQHENGSAAGSIGLACWSSSTKLLEKPALSAEDFEIEYNLGVPMELSKISLDIPLWAAPGDKTLLQGGSEQSDSWGSLVLTKIEASLVCT